MHALFPPSVWLWRLSLSFLLALLNEKITKTKQAKCKGKEERRGSTSVVVGTGDPPRLQLGEDRGHVDVPVRALTNLDLCEHQTLCSLGADRVSVTTLSLKEEH